MKIQLRPFSVTFIVSMGILLGLLYLYQGGGAIPFMLGALICFGVLGYLVGRNWPVNAWQIGLLASLPCWAFLAWRLLTSHDPYNVGIDISLFVWLPIISLLSSFAGTYWARWTVIRQRKRDAVAGE